jgi:hypothetical protein
MIMPLLQQEKSTKLDILRTPAWSSPSIESAKVVMYTNGLCTQCTIHQRKKVD